MIGLFRHTLVLPDETVEHDSLSLIMLHEVLHCKRGDIWIRLFSLITLSVHWFNPFVYVMNRHITAETEYSCDDVVLRHTGAEQRFIYGEVILHAAFNSRKVFTGLAAPLTSGGRNLRRRLASIAEKKSAKHPFMRSCIALLLVCATIAFGLVSCDLKGTTSGTTSDLKSTLSLYCLNSDSSVNVYMNYFANAYPKVTVNKTSFTSSTQMDNKIITSLNTKSGPDVIIFSVGTTLDTVRMAENGEFQQLNSYMKADKSFKASNYLSGSLAAGVVNGKQYIMPLTFSVPFILYKQTSGSAYSNQVTIKGADFLNSVTKELTELPSNPSTLPFATNSLDIYSSAYNIAPPVTVSADGKPTFNTNNIKSDVEFLKATLTAQDKYNTLKNSIHNFTDEIKILHYLFADYADIPHISTLFQSVYQNAHLKMGLLFPTASGNLNQCARISSYGVITKKAGSAAYDFLRVAMDTNAVSDANEDYECSVNKNNFANAVSFYQSYSGADKYGDPIASLTNANAKELLNMYNHISNAAIENQTIDYYFTDFNPYDNGTQTYDQCLSTYEQAVRSYLSE